MENNNNDFNGFSIVKFIWKKRILLAIVTVIAAILSVFASYLIKPQFKSQAVIYAPRTNSLAKILMNEQNYNERLDVKAYAIEEETEQMMQILSSRTLKDTIAARFNLPTYYGLDTNAASWRYKLYDYMNGFIDVKRTSFGAISVTVSDWDNHQAAHIANSIIDYLDTIKNNIERERAAASYKLLSEQYAKINEEIKRIDDTLSVLASNGVLMLDRQTERITQQYAIAVAQGNSGAVARLQKEIDKLAKWGPTVLTLQNEQFTFTKYQALCKQKMMDAEMDMKGGIPVKFVIDRAIAADKKSYPKKSVVVILSTLGAFFVTLLIALLVERIRKEQLLSK